MKAERLDIHQTITDKIVAAIAAGAGDFKLPWQRSGMATLLPKNAISGHVFSGINTVSLWVAAMDRGYDYSLWGTYRQWASVNAQVRQGEKASPIVFYKQYDVDPNPEDESDDGSRRVARASWVFNVSQVDGYTAEAPLPDLPPLEREARAEAFVATTGVEIRHGGEQAYYKPIGDFVQMPAPERFTADTRVSDYYSVLFHELTHAGGAKHRCNRQFGKKYADELYAIEELVAELGAAFLCAELGISSTPRADHASYLSHWLRILKSDNRAIFTAAARASETVRYYHSLRPKE